MEPLSLRRLGPRPRRISAQAKLPAAWGRPTPDGGVAALA